MLSPQIPVAKEGYPFIGLAAFCALFFALLGYTALSLVLFIISLFVLSFFRDPERFTPTDPQAVVSPADGKIILIEPVEDTIFTGRAACKVSIFMNVFNVHVNRIPYSGCVKKIIYKPGKFYSADTAKGGLENEYCGAVLQTNDGKLLAFVQIAGLIARRIVCWLEPDDTVTKGRRFGLIRFGSRVDLYLPPEITLGIKIGDKVCAGETVIGRLP